MGFGIKFLLKFMAALNLLVIVYFVLKSRKTIDINRRDVIMNDQTVIKRDLSLEHDRLSKQFYKNRLGLNLSNLGKILFLNESKPVPKSNIFKILIWKKGHFLENRHMKSFSKTLIDPFEFCSVNNCQITYKSEDLDNADAVIIHLHWIKSSKDYPDPHKRRPSDQRWIFLTDESALRTFIYGYDWELLNGVFNWSMTYKMESDVPVPYGRTLPLFNNIVLKSEFPENIIELIPYGKTKRRDVLVAVSISNCMTSRLKYIKKISEYIDVDIYGNCGTKYKNACPGHFKNDCPHLQNYLFYLSFENSLCDQYMTEKVFWNAYKNGAIPVIHGPTKKICKQSLPPESYLHMDDYSSPDILASHILLMNKTWNEELFKYHQWRTNFKVFNEHGYFGSRSVHYCRICEALNYNDKKPKVYKDLKFYLDPRTNCQ